MAFKRIGNETRDWQQGNSYSKGRYRNGEGNSG